MISSRRTYTWPHGRWSCSEIAERKCSDTDVLVLLRDLMKPAGFWTRTPGARSAGQAIYTADGGSFSGTAAGITDLQFELSPKCDSRIGSRRHAAGRFGTKRARSYGCATRIVSPVEPVTPSARHGPVPHCGNDRGPHQVEQQRVPLSGRDPSDISWPPWHRLAGLAPLGLRIGECHRFALYRSPSSQGRGPTGGKICEMASQRVHFARMPITDQPGCPIMKTGVPTETMR